MSVADVLILIVVLGLVALVLYFIFRKDKNSNGSKHCKGCPSAKSCQNKKNGCGEENTGKDKSVEIKNKE